MIINLSTQQSSFALALLVLIGGCGRVDQPNQQRLSSLAPNQLTALTQCQDLNQKPELLYYTVANSDGSSTTDNFVGAFYNQSCERKLIFLESCSKNSAKALLGLVTTEPKLMSADEWSDFQQNDSTRVGDFHSYPHLSCASGSMLEPQLPSSSSPEVHIVSGNQGYSSLWMKPRDAVGRLHFKAPNHCFALSKKLNAISWAGRLPDPSVALTPLVLSDLDESISLTCAREKAPPVQTQGWSVAHTGGDPAGRVYMLNYKSPQAGQSLQLLIRRVDNEDINAENVTTLESALSRTLNRPVSSFTVDNLDFDKELLLFDFCTQNCAAFKAKHFIFDGTERPFFANVKTGSNQLLRSVNSLFEVYDSLRVRSEESWTFATCAADQSLAPYLGFSPGVKTVSERSQELYQSALNPQEIEPKVVPCAKVQSNICRVELNDVNLSSSVSSGNYQISSYMNRPRFGVCSTATQLELSINGTAAVTNYPWVIGNLPETVQKKFDEIRVIGAPGSSVSLGIDCSKAACGNTPMPAIKIVGDVPVRIEGLRFVSTVNPTQARTLAVQRSAGAAQSAVTRLKNLEIGFTSSPNEFPFHTGLLLEQGDSYLLNTSVRSYYKGIVANMGFLSVIGGKQKDSPLAKELSTFKLVLPMDAGTTPAPEPGSSAFKLSMLRAMDLTQTRSFLFGLKIDAPVAIAINGDLSQDKPAVQAWFTELSNSTKRFSSLSYALHVTGSSKTVMNYSYVHDMAGLVTFDAGNLNLPSVDFEAFVTESFISKKAKLVTNREKGQINPVDCTVDPDTGRCYLQL